MSEKLAIVFAHRKPADYLVYAAAQAKSFNPDAEIHALLDYADPLVSRYATVGNIFDHLDDVREFERDWINFSDLGYHYECFCSQRWLILRNYARAHGLRRFIYLDSDVMCYANLAEDLAPFRSAPVSYAGGSAHTLLVEDFDRYEEFCTFLIERYRSPEKVSEMHAQYRKHKERTRSGGIQDMAHWSAFERESGLKFGNLALANNGLVTSTHSKTFDPNLGYAVPVDFTWKNGQPSGRDRYSNTAVRFSTVHYQGSFKYLIPKRFTGSPLEARRLKGELRNRRILSILQSRGGKIYQALSGPLEAREGFNALRPITYKNQYLTFSR